LPNIPSVEIIENGINHLMLNYKEICSIYGHLTGCDERGKVVINKKPFSLFLSTIGHYEKEMLDSKLTRKDNYFPDRLLESCLVGDCDVDINKYRVEYCEARFGKVDMDRVCYSYLDGLQWVFSYYVDGLPSWVWQYRYHYGPPAFVLSQYVESWRHPEFELGNATTPFQQLLCVLPPTSCDLLPSPLRPLLVSKDSPLKKFCPEEFHIDLSGKRKEWEGVVLLPEVDFGAVVECYNKEKCNFCERDMTRDCLKSSIRFTYSKDQSSFVSKYGRITQNLEEQEISL